MIERPAPLAPESAWRGRADPLRWAVVAVDVLAVVGLFVGSLLFLLPLTPHLEISSDSMDPFSHAWEIWSGRSSPLSSHNLLYAYGRAWSSLLLLLGADGLDGIATRMAVASSAMTPIVYIAGRILTGGISPGVSGRPVRRVGAVLGPLLGAMLLVRFPGFLWSQVAGSHVYLTTEWSALALLPTALLLRVAGVGGGDAGPYAPPQWAVPAAISLGVCMAMATLNHPYGASQIGILVPLAVLLVSRLRRRGVLLIAIAAGVAGVMCLPHAFYLLEARGHMDDTLVEYARSDAEFGYLSWSRSADRLTMARTTSSQGWLLFQAPLVAVVTGLAVSRWRPRLGTATAAVGSIALSTALAELLLTRVSQHIQPYHWHPLLPLAALSGAMAVGALVDVALRRSQSERIRDAERGRGGPTVVLRRLPVTLVAVGLVAYVGSGITHSLTEDRGYLSSLWVIAMPRQAVQHERVATAMLAEVDEAGRAPAFGGIDFPDFSLTLDPIALTFELISRGQDIGDVARTPTEDEVMLLHIGLGQSEALPVLEGLPKSIEFIRGDDEFLLLRGTTASFRVWTRNLCDGRPGPPRLRGVDRDSYWLRGSLEVKHLASTDDVYPAPYSWTHPCMEPFAWPDITQAEYPLMPEGTEPGDIAAPDQYLWTELRHMFTSRNETTVRDWGACVADGGCESLGPVPEDPDAVWLPVVGVTAEQALTYCRWLADDVEWEGRRWTGDLPNSVEMEILGGWRRSVSERRSRWPWGDEFVQGAANGAGDGDGYSTLAPVGTFPSGRSPMAHEDIAGNAAEWVHRATRPSRDGEHPWGRTLPGFLLAGGSFRSPPDALRNGVFEVPTDDRALDDVGFRCVIRAHDPEEPL